jgi:hypothetical protein
MPRIYLRSDKLNHADTILHEIDMLRFAASRLDEGDWRLPRDAWVYLESFLVHYLNLIEFLGKPTKPSDTDLHVTTIWRQEKLTPPAALEEIHKKGVELWKEYAKGEGRIPQFLQHSTKKRVEFKDWPVSTMSERIEPLLAEVEKHLRSGTGLLNPVKEVKFRGPLTASTTTATMTTAAPLYIDGDVKKRTPH